MQLKKITLTLFLCLSNQLVISSAFASEPDLYDELMAKSVGQYKIGQTPMNYAFSGQVNYVYGFNQLDSGIHNSYLDLSTSTSLAYGVDVIVSGGALGIFESASNDYGLKFNGDLKLAKDGSEVRIGYDKFLANRILGSRLKLNSDWSLSRTYLGQQLLSYEAFVEYAYSAQNYSGSIALDASGNFYLGLSSYLSDADISLHLFEGYDQDVNVFFDLSVLLFEPSFKASFGLGFIDREVSFIADVSYFPSDRITLYGNVSGWGDFSSLSVGADYSYRSLVVYVEGVIELRSSPLLLWPRDGVMLGVKFVF